MTPSLVTLATWTLLALAPPAPTAALPRFEPSECPFPVEPPERIECGMLVVPENRSKPDSREIRLPVRRLRSRSQTPAPDPVLFMPGGPGVSAVDGVRTGRGNPVLDERDFIVIEPRGGRHAQPALECPEINAHKADVAAGRIRGDKALQAMTRAAERCRQTLTAAGVDLDGYTTEATADDIDDLRRVLGISQLNLSGLSYSTRLMLTLVRRHPEGVRSVVLDSVMPPEVGYDEVASHNVWRALNAVFDGCAIDAECGKAYPDLPGRFARLVAAADRKPLPLGLKDATSGGAPVEVRGAQVVDALYGALHDPRRIPHLPRVIAKAAAGDYSELRPLVEANLGPSPFTWGLRLSVWCSEETPFEDPARIAAQRSPARGLGGLDGGTAALETCRAWNVAPAPAAMNAPVKSDVPALVFAGEFDPDTPPDWGRQVLETLPNASYVEMRGKSHGASFNRCGGGMVLAFLRNPSTPPPADCSLRERGADFGLAASPPAP
ncbi:alpha/beta fold hydrolase [Myxococcus sp. K15C18031901]|uniref:alpha/beta fold hydrolase n=1 Tax=Myxococcus dinghuensis TaxID=2906761 RepID=UPI0020A79CF4|nr:alpha/beta fold hydrolase [Myxococcus dinghuensis]MCP3097397.1 alpha/beta fold hydrolase [Myxococcus dinghuensis]